MNVSKISRSVERGRREFIKRFIEWLFREEDGVEIESIRRKSSRNKIYDVVVKVYTGGGYVTEYYEFILQVTNDCRIRILRREYLG
jgi:hypothetical protein